ATSMALVVVAFPLAYLGGTYGSLPTLLAAALLLDIGVTGNLIVGQRAINQLGNEHRSRLNGLYVAAFYFGGAMGSAVAAFAFSHEGWGGVSAIGLAVAIAAILYFAFQVWKGREG
ncbi:MAG: MFS transporter, partial [Parvibaculum sedimenti]